MKYFTAALFIAFAAPAWAQFDPQAEQAQHDFDRQREGRLQQEQESRYNQQARQFQYNSDRQQGKNPGLPGDSSFYDYAPR